VAYTAQPWANGPSGNTPLNASRMNHLESGVYDAHTIGTQAQTDVDALETTVTALSRATRLQPTRIASAPSPATIGSLYHCDSSSAMTITLPAGQVADRIGFVNAGTGIVTLKPANGQTLFGQVAANPTLARGDSLIGYGYSNGWLLQGTTQSALDARFQRSAVAIPRAQLNFPSNTVDLARGVDWPSGVDWTLDSVVTSSYASSMRGTETATLSNGSSVTVSHLAAPLAGTYRVWSYARGTGISVTSPGYVNSCLLRDTAFVQSRRKTALITVNETNPYNTNSAFTHYSERVVHFDAGQRLYMTFAALSADMRLFGTNELPNNLANYGMELITAD
jgi:hypothetical protein